MNNNLATGVLAGVVALLGAYVFTHQTAPLPVQTQTNLGALSGPDILSPYLSIGGVRSWYGSMDLRVGTTSVCAVQAPAATTTLVSATARIDTAAGYATAWEIGNATTAFATTTSLGLLGLAASTNGALIATTSVTALKDGIVPPNTWINVRLATTTTSASFQPTGRCSVFFREI